MKFGITDKDIDIIQSIFQKYDVIDKAILYGSRAKGNYKNGSDIDLTLIGQTLDLTTLFKIETDIDNTFIPYKVDLSLYKDIDNSDLKEHIKRVGKEFYNRGQTRITDKSIS